MDKKYEINEWQKKIIQSRNNLDFETCLEQSTKNKTAFNKTYRKEVDRFSREMYKNGIQFYGITINFPEYLEGDLKELWSKIHIKIEEFIQITKNDLELCEFLYLSVEKHENEKEEKKIKKNSFKKVSLKTTGKKASKKLENFPHIHGVLGVRSLLGQNKNLVDEIDKIYSEYYTDIKVDFLHSVRKIYKTWNYIMKKNNYKFHRMVSFSNIYEQEYSSLYEHQFKYDIKGFLNLGTLLTQNYSDVKGIGSQIKTNKSIILYLLNLYLNLEGIFINNNEFYIKLENSKYSWKFLDSIEFLKKSNVGIIEKLKKLFPQQLSRLETDDLLINNFDSVYQSIKQYNNYLPHIDFSSDIVEFSDGLYFLNYDYFLSFKKNRELLLKAKINCFKFFDKSFVWCKTSLPKNWLIAIANNMKSEQELENFCALLGRYFHSRKMILHEEKKKTMCIVGASNTGKTTLVANIVTQILGQNNVGMIDNTDTFAFEEIENKKVIICDEFVYKEMNRSNLLKSLDGDIMLYDKKNISKKIYQNEAPILFMFNPSDKNKKMFEDPAFINRLLIYTFTYDIKAPDPKIKEILEEELPQIMIYCNHLFLKNLVHVENTFLKNKKYMKKHVNDYLQTYIE